MPIREAIRRLEAEGWVTTALNRSAQVASFNEQNWRELMQMFAVLEGYTVALAAEHLSEDDILALRSCNDALEAAIERNDFSAMTERKEAFHNLIYERCPNARLREDLRRHQERLYFMRRPDLTAVLAESSSAVAEHKHLIELLESGASFGEIELYAREHKVHAIDVYEKVGGSRFSLEK